MDFLVELVISLLFEVPVEAAMESKRLKTGVKTAIFAVLGGLLTVFFWYLSICCWLRSDATATFFMTIISAIFTVGVIFGAIHGHKRNWKQK